MDPVTYQVIKNKFQAIITEQAIALKSVSGSPVVTESSDFGNAICLPDGTIVARGQQVLAHASSITLMVRSVIADCQEDPGYGPGDMFFLNDPWKGALHQSDAGVVAPLFFEGRLVAWSGTAAHQLDVGGMVPGSWCPNATEKFQEGVSFPPVKLVERGHVRRDIWNVILAQSRVPFLLGLDLKALIASNSVATRRLTDLINRYGLPAVEATMNKLIDVAEEGLRSRLRELPDGVFRAIDFLDHDGHENKLYHVSLALTKKDDNLTFDFTGSSPQAPGFINGTQSTLWGGVICATLVNLGYELPWNGGIHKPLTVIAPKGIICNAEPPAPVSGAPTAVMRLVVNTCSSAMAKMLACSDKYIGEAKALSSGTFVNFMLSGRDQYGQTYGTMFLDPGAGGEGAYHGRDGMDINGSPQPTPNIANVETVENLVPVLYLKRWILPDTGGAGKYRGGNTAGVALVVHDVSGQRGVLIGHGAEVPNAAGAWGGLPGSAYYSHIAAQTAILDDFKSGKLNNDLDTIGGKLTDLGAKPGQIYLDSADVFQYTWQGGGGWGDPLERDPQKVLRDVQWGRVTAEWARKLYGVVIGPGPADVDEEATKLLRQEIRATRAHGSRRPALSLDSAAEASRRVVPLGEYLRIDRLASGALTVVCRCGYRFGPADKNWKDAAAVQSVAPEALGPRRRLHRDLEIRQFICPSCATLLSTELYLKGEANLFDVELALAASPGNP